MSLCYDHMMDLGGDDNLANERFETMTLTGGTSDDPCIM